MGKEILYCTTCGRQLSGDDFTRGRAHTYDNRQFCSGCVPASRATSAALPTGSGSRIKAPRASSMHLPVQGASPSAPSSTPLIVSLAVAAGVVLLLVVLFLNPSAPPAPAPSSTPPAAPRVVEPRKPVDDPARTAVAQAREFSSGNPHAVEERVRLWEKAVASAVRTPYAEEAAKGLEQAVARRKEEFSSELRSVESKIAERKKAEQFGAAVDVLEEAKKRHDAAEWTIAVATRIREIQETADRLYPEVKSRAMAAQAQGDSARVAEQRTRLAGWGRKDLIADLDGELSKVLPKEPIPAGATLLLKFPSAGSPRTYRLSGTLREGALVMGNYYDKAVLGGFESIREVVTIPTSGEFWLTYSTRSPKPLHLRFRIIEGDKTLPFNWVLERPEVGRPARVKVPMTAFNNYGHKAVKPGDTFATIYIQQDDLHADLILYEALLFRTKE